MSSNSSYTQKPDGRIFASYPMPAKIDLINERPRRESLIERHLEDQFNLGVPKITVSEQTVTTTTTTTQQQQPGNQNNLVEKQSVVEHQAESSVPSYSQSQFKQQQQQRIANNTQQEQRSPATCSNTINKTNAAALLAAELAEKEANLMRDITALQQRPYSPFKTPNKIDLSTEQKIIQQQYQNAPSPRPNSRASSARSASADLLEKEAKLMREIEEIESKPFNPQTLVVEREQWYEYPEGRSNDRQMTDSRRTVRDFCSMAPGLCQEKHQHQEKIIGLGASPTPGSIHTTIIRSPRREIDNKSPLPFAFDNFSTKGVRGNIASVGAVEPDRPRPPIYPIVKRTPSPNFARGSNF